MILQQQITGLFLEQAVHLSQYNLIFFIYSSVNIPYDLHFADNVDF